MAGSSSSSMVLWQHPFVNLFKQFPVGKQGDVSLVMDRDIKSTVHRISGAVPAVNYVQVPKAGAHSLGLTGRYVYFLFKPMPAKYFVVHMEAGTREGVAVRVSFSNLFKEVKSTSTWLQFPFASCSSGSTEPRPRWALLTVDLQSALATFFNRTYMCLKSVKVCANVLIKGVFTSNQEYSPHHQEGARFFERYNCSVFPAKQPQGLSSKPGTSMRPAVRATQPHSPVHPAAVRPEHPPTVTVTSPPRKKNSGSTTTSNLSGTARQGLGVPPPKAPASTRQVFITRHGPDQQPSTSDVPLLQLKRVVGMDDHACCPVLFSADGKEAVFASHCTVVALETASRRQRFFAGHSDKVSSLALSTSDLLASGQGGAQAVVRVWQFSTAQCLALFKAHHSALHELRLSPSGSVLLGVGSDRQGRGSVVMWNTSAIFMSGEVQVAAQAHTDVSIRRMQLSSDCSRMVSCGQSNVRLWRLKGKSLKSCPVDLGHHHHLLFTDVSFSEGDVGSAGEARVLACTDSGLVLDVDCDNMSVGRVWQLSPPTAPIGVTCLKVHECFAVSGHEDGSLCVWPADFSKVLLEAHHDAPIQSLDVSLDGMTVLTATQAGTLGMLDAASKAYAVLMRSHAGKVVGGSLHNSGRQLATVGMDQSVRVWQAENGSQTHEFRVAEDTPTTVDIHPVGPLVAVGYQSGAMRVFKLDTSSLAAEHKHLTSQRSVVVYAPNGDRLYSTSVVRDAISGKPGVKALALESGGFRVAVIAATDTTVSVLDAADLQEVLCLDITVVAGRSDPSDHAVSLCFTPDSSLLVLTVRGTLLKFSADTGALTSKVPHLHNTTCSCMCIAPNGAHLLTAGDHCIKIWDYSSGKPLTPQVYRGHSEEVAQILIGGRVCVTVAESICFWLYQGSNVTMRGTDDLTSLLPRRHAPSPAQYTRPLPTVAAPTPLQTVSHIGPDLECTPALSIPPGLTASVGHSSEASSSQETPVSLQRTAHCSSEEGDSASEEGDNVSAEGDSVSEEGDSTPERGVCASKESERVPGMGDTPSEERDRGSRVKIVNRANPGTSDNPPTRSALPVSSPPSLVPGPPSQVGGRVCLKSVVGYSGGHRHNLVWHPLGGFMAYSSGSVVVLDHFSTSPQGHMIGHSRPVSAVALQSDGKTLASAAASGGEVLIWDVPSLTCRGQLRFHDGAVSNLAYSRDDRFLASVGGASGGRLAVWCTGRYSLLAAAELQADTLDLAWDTFSANKLATVGAGPHLSFWTLLERPSCRSSELQASHVPVPQELLHTEGSKASEFTAGAYGPGSKLFVASSSGEVCVWSSAKKTCLFHWCACTTAAVTTLSWAGGFLVTGAVGGALDLWDVRDAPGNVLKVIRCRSLQLDNTISCTSFEDKGEMVFLPPLWWTGLVGTAQGSVHYVNWGESACVKLVSGHSDVITSCATWGNSLATTCADGSVSLWCLPPALLASFCTPAKTPTCVDVSPRSKPSKVSCIVGYSDGCLRTFDSRHMSRRGKMQPHNCSVTSVRYSTDGTRVLSGCAGGVVAVSSTTSGICLAMISDHKGSPVTAITTSQHTLHLPSCGPQPVQIWMVSSQDGRHSIWGSRWLENIHVLVDWLAHPTTGQPSVARFSPLDADLVLYTAPGGSDPASVLNSYSISHRKLVQTTPVELNVCNFDVSHDASIVAAGNGVLALIDCDTGQTWTYRGIPGQLTNVSVLETGTAICTTDSAILEWEFPTDEPEAH